MNINWYPGHMAKAKKEISQLNKLVDLFLVMLDARAPKSTRNIELEEIFHDKPSLYLLNKSDLADSNKTKEWINFLNINNYKAIEIDSLSGKNIKKILETSFQLVNEKIESYLNKGRRKIVRFAVIGIPNVGKSTLINKISNASKAKIGDKPGVTRSKQWIKVNDYFELLDTPGILYPKLDDIDTAYKMCAIGSIKDELYNPEEIAIYLATLLKNNYSKIFNQKYKTDFSLIEGQQLLLEIGRKRGCIIKGGEIDTQKAALLLLDDFRKGRIGRITLDEI
ncbi:ribosome biogenesis GTPase YlqF [Caldicellulosiruptoraceae bacterium PP1]